MSKLNPPAWITRVRPPTAASRSKTVTRTPAAESSIAAASPPGPAPTRATLRGGDARRARGAFLAWVSGGEAWVVSGGASKTIGSAVGRRLDRIPDRVKPGRAQALGSARFCKCAAQPHCSRRLALVAGALAGWGRAWSDSVYRSGTLYSQGAPF